MFINTSREFQQRLLQRVKTHNQNFLHNILFNKYGNFRPPSYHTFQCKPYTLIFRPSFVLSSTTSITLRKFSTSIEIENTPNPNAKMFFPLGYNLLPPKSPDSVSFDHNSAYDASKPKSSLAQSLLEIDGVYSVLLCKDYLTVVKNRQVPWPKLEDIITKIVNEYSETGSLPSYQEAERENKFSKTELENEDVFSSDLEEIIDAIKTLIDTRARPMIMEDGGDIEFIRFDEDEGIVWIYLKGACEGCPSSTLTLQDGLATMLRYFIPEVKHVKQCDENGEPLLDEDEIN